MTSKERYDLLVEWKKQYEICDESQKLLDKLLNGFDTNSPLGDSIWKAFDKYTETLSVLIGDTFNWLSWFCWESNMGSKEFLAKASSWKKTRKIKTLKDLCKIIEADLT